MEGPDEGFNIDSGQWLNVLSFSKLVSYNFHELGLELDDRGVIGWGLGKHNGGKLDDETKMKVNGDVGVLVKEASMEEKPLPNIRFVWHEHFELSELKDMPELCGQSDCI